MAIDYKRAYQAARNLPQGTIRPGVARPQQGGYTTLPNYQVGQQIAPQQLPNPQPGQTQIPQPMPNRYQQSTLQHQTSITPDYSKMYNEAKARGDWQGMQAANDAANAMRKSQGIPEQSAYKDIGAVQGRSQQYIPQQQSYTDVNQEYTRKLQENEQKARDLYNSIVRQGTQRLEGQRGDVGRTYEQSAQQAYLRQMERERTEPQRLASLGITGGAAESTALASDAMRSREVMVAQTARDKAMRDIDAAVAELQNSGDVQAAQYILQNSEKIAESYAQAARADISRRDALQQQEWQRGYQESALTGMYQGQPTVQSQQYQQSLEDQEYQRKVEEAQLYAAYGDYSKLRALGINPQVETRPSGTRSSSTSETGQVTYQDTQEPTKAEEFGPEYDMKSIIDLGYGPISKSRLEQLIASGEIEAKVVDGKLKFSKVKKSNLFNPF